jgi:hypothetical protein
VRLLADHFTNKIQLPASVHLSPGIVMSSNLYAFREMRPTEDDAAAIDPAVK